MCLEGLSRKCGLSRQVNVSDSFSYIGNNVQCRDILFEISVFHGLRNLHPHEGGPTPWLRPPHIIWALCKTTLATMVHGLGSGVLQYFMLVTRKDVQRIQVSEYSTSFQQCSVTLSARRSP